MANFKKYIFVFFLIFSLQLSNSFCENKKSIFKFRITDITDDMLGKTIKTIVQIHQKVKQIKQNIFKDFETKIDSLLKELNQLRDIYYQYHIVQAARKLEGKNLYHSYGKGGENAEDNTCVVGWCIAMSETQHPKFRQLAVGKIKLLSKTLEREQDKLDRETPLNLAYYSPKVKRVRANLMQKKSKYINVQKIVDIAEGLGFLPLDLDLTQTGDFVIQYYDKPRVNMTYGPQHISIIHQIVHYKSGKFELRDWHEGIDDKPYIYRTGYNLKSSYNNLYHPINVYYGFQTDLGKPRSLKRRNPNVSQGFGYFGNNIDKAKKLIKKLNQVRGSMFVSRKLFSFLGFLGI